MKKLSLYGAELGYRGHAVLRGVNVVIGEGDICLINGPNGTGKTTLGLGMLGLIPLLKGTRESNFLAPAYVPQSNRLDVQYPLTLETLVAMGVPSYSSLNILSRWKNRIPRRELIERTLARVGLAGKGKQLFHRSSGGEFQRALIARALVSGPDLMLLDEPFANIDREGKREIREFLLKEGLERGITLIIIDHHENVDFCSNCLEISGGEVTASGSN